MITSKLKSVIPLTLGSTVRIRSMGTTSFVLSILPEYVQIRVMYSEAICGVQFDVASHRETADSASFLT